MNKRFFMFLFFLSIAVVVNATVPTEINYQGFVEVDGVPFTGTGSFKFTITNQAGDTYYWTNDGSTPVPPAAPTAAVSLSVSEGLLSVGLGDDSHPNMVALPATVFENQDTWLKVWFDDGTNGFQELGPKQKLASVPYAMMAQTLPDASITGSKLKRESVWPEHEGRSNTVVTYYAEMSGNVTFDVATVPATKTLVITDILLGTDGALIAPAADYESGCVTIQYGGGSTILFKDFHSKSSQGGILEDIGNSAVSLKGGLVVPAGETIQIVQSNSRSGFTRSVTLTGYTFSN